MGLSRDLFALGVLMHEALNLLEGGVFLWAWHGN